MGSITRILEIVENTDEGENILDLKVDIGGNDVILAPMMSSPGDDSKPLPEDYAACVSHLGGSNNTAVAYGDSNNKSAVENGEKRIYARNALGEIVAYIHLKNDGTISIWNDKAQASINADGELNYNITRQEILSTSLEINKDGELNFESDIAPGLKSNLSIDKQGKNRFSNPFGFYEMSEIGIFNVNGNFTVGP